MDPACPNCNAVANIAAHGSDGPNDERLLDATVIHSVDDAVFLDPINFAHEDERLLFTVILGPRMIFST